MRRRPSTAIALALLVLAPIAAVAWLVLRRRARRVAVTPELPARSRTRDRAREGANIAAPDAASPAPVATTGPGVRRRRELPIVRSVSLSATVATTCLGLLVFMSVPTTWATLNDQVTMSQVTTTGGTVNVPTSFGVVDTGSAIRATWTAPATGLVPDSYDIYRTTTAGSYGAPTDTDTASPYDDPTALECTDYWYQARSSRVNLKSTAFTPEVGPINIDHTNPVIAAGNLYFDPTPLPKVADFVRVSGGNVEVYANVTDNCSSGGALAVNFTFGAPFSTTVAATPGSFTPVGGGPTYNYMFGPYAIPAATLTDGQAVTWTIDATDAAGNTASSAGTTFTGDGAGPTAHVSKFVSAFTNFYNTTVGYGEIPSDGTQRANGSYVYGGASDPSGISAITANIDVNATATYRIRTGSTAVPLVQGSYTLDATTGPQAWQWRSAAQVINTGLPDGVRYYRLTATDALGNTATTSGDLPVQIDDTVPSNTATCTNGGTNNNTLADPDYTDFNFNDAMWPESIRPGWNGSPFTATANLRNGTGNNDFFDFNTDFGMQMFQGTTQATSYNLALNVVGGVTPFANTQVSFTNATTMRIAYKTGSVAGLTNGNATMYISANLRDPAGNKAAGTFTETCSRNSW